MATPKSKKTNAAHWNRARDAVRSALRNLKIIELPLHIQWRPKEILTPSERKQLAEKWTGTFGGEPLSFGLLGLLCILTLLQFSILGSWPTITKSRMSQVARHL